MDQFIFENEFASKYAILPKSACYYLKDAGEDQLKALIFFLTRNDKSLMNEEELAKAGLNKESFLKDLAFWQERGVIAPHNKPQKESYFKDYKIQEVSEAICADPKLKSFIEMAEKVLSKPLTSSEIRILYGFCDSLCMTPAAVIILLEYCCSQNKKGIRYIEKVAVSWAKEGILTHEDAMEHIKKMTTQNDYTEKIKILLGISGRAVSPSEQKFIENWQKMNLSDELLLSAYDKTVINTGKVSFAYMNTILLSWQKNGVKTIKDAEKKKKISVGANKKGPEIAGNLDYDKAELDFIKSIKNKGG